MGRESDAKAGGTRPAALETLRYQAILDTARDAIISIDRNGIVTDFNHAAEEMFGYQAREVIGNDVSMLMPSPYREEHSGYIRSYQRTGEKRAIGRIRDVEARRKSGEVFAMELSVSEARVGDELLYTAFIRDVSALRRAQAWAEVRHEVTRLLAVFDTLAEVSQPLLQAVRKIGAWDVGELWTLDAGADELCWEQGAFGAGIDAEEFTAASRGVRLMHGAGLVRRAWESGQPSWIDDVSADPAFVRRQLVGKEGLRGGCAFPVRDEHGVVAVMAFYSRDVRSLDEEIVRLTTSIARQIGDFIAHKRAEQEIRKLETLAVERGRLADIGAITAKLVHDLGNPLSGISMQAELLKRKVGREDTSPAALSAPVDQILAGIARLRDLVRGFTDFAREQKLDLAAIDLHAFLEELAESWKPVAAARNIEVVAALPDGMPTLLGDQAKLRRVFDNLTKNAIEAIEDTRGLVTIEARPPNNGRIEVTIADSGSGIPPEIDVFKLFETTKPYGTGIGLPVCKEIVSAHGGNVEFAPNTPCGTVFTVSLPLVGPAA
jgi:two-component system sensor kinase FixL